MSKKLSDLLAALDEAGMSAVVGRLGIPPQQYKERVHSTILTDVTVASLVFDSREVIPGSLFFALPGTHTSGNKYISQAISRGAAAVVYQGELAECGEITMQTAQGGGGSDMAEVTFVQVKDARRAMAPIADCFFDHPSRRIIVIGVTGTEGKSSTVSFIWQLLRLIGKKAGFVSTVEYSTGGDAVPNPQHQTTPEAPIVQARLDEMAEAGCEYAVLEASSHALSPRTSRLGCVLFDCAVFMNVTLEHLEFHGTFEQYRDDKANLFRALDAHGRNKTIGGVTRQVPSAGVVNADDKSAAYFAQATHAKVLSFGTGGRCDLTASDVVSDEKGISFMSGNTRVTAPLPGTFNALNIMASVLAVNSMTGVDIAVLFSLCANLVSIKGRMQHINEGQPFEVIVDYAHTPSSFMMVLPPIRKRCWGKVIAVFGSGGERDHVKRPLQGQAAAQYCDQIVLANEDPRQEDEMQILREIAQGAEKEGKKEGENLFLIPDRVSAIRFAFSRAQSGDIVLLLGKGHENSIIGKDGPVPYDEATAARAVLRE